MKLAVAFTAAAAFVAAAAPESAPPPGMVSLPAGSYVPLFVGNPKPRLVKAFWLDEAPVTNGEFLEFVRKHSEWRRSAVKEVFADKMYLRHWAGDLDLGPAAAKLEEAPVTHVSWFAARAFLASKGRRLPTIDEWEFAAQADSTKADASKEPGFTQKLLDWYARPTPNPLPPAREATPNFYGARGLHGLVWEWTDDFNNAMDTGEGRSGGGLERDLFCAGGSANSPDKSNYAAFMRFAFRSSLRANYTVPNLGFRGAWSPAQDGAAPPPSAQQAETAAVLPGDSVYHTPGLWKNQRAETVALRSLRGKIQVLAMGYTSCKFACPRITADLRSIERQLGEISGTLVNFDFVSFDSERDTPEALQAHAKTSGLEHWNFLASDAVTVRQLAAVLGVKYEKIDGDYAHSNTIFVLNRDGRVIHRQEGLGGMPDATVAAIKNSLTSKQP